MKKIFFLIIAFLNISLFSQECNPLLTDFETSFNCDLGSCKWRPSNLNLVDSNSPNGGKAFRVRASSKRTERSRYNFFEGSALGELTYPLRGLEVNENYQVTFYQAIEAESIGAAYWEINGFRAPRMEDSPIISTKWGKVTYTFKAPSVNYDLHFSAEYLNSVNTRPVYLLIDGVFIAKQNTCDIKACEDFSSFNPSTNKAYVLSAWVKEEANSPLPKYNGPEINIKFNGALINEGSAKPSGQIIEGWQQIQKVFRITGNVSNLEIELNNTGANRVYFDDIRVHPFDGNMKSFVYDPVSQRLMAELDENNYATFYEYDNEGGLIRVKKETERGVQTIQETRSSTFLKNNGVTIQN